MITSLQQNPTVKALRGAASAAAVAACPLEAIPCRQVVIPSTCVM